MIEQKQDKNKDAEPEKLDIVRQIVVPLPATVVGSSATPDQEKPKPNSD